MWLGFEVCCWGQVFVFGSGGRMDLVSMICMLVLSCLG
jgi:hypothetical protein